MGWSPLPGASSVLMIQQVDIEEVPLSIQEHRGHQDGARVVRETSEAPLPIRIERRQFGPKLTTL